MITTSHEPEASETLETLTEIGRDCVKRPSRAELDRGLTKLHSRIASGRVRRVIGRTLVAGFAIVSTVFVIQWRVASTRTLAYQIEGGSLLEGGYLRELGHAGVALLFNEGSTCILMPGSRGRLRTINPEGARVAIDSGTASFRITPNRERRWSVEAGPFLITVKGTVFVASWEPSSARFGLKLTQGSVVVSGPISGGDLTLRAGQTLAVNLSKAETLITEDLPGETRVDSGITAAESSASTPTTVAPPSDPPNPAGALPSNANGRSAPVAPQNERRWAQALANGEWDRILEDVDRSGVDAALNGASSEDLIALANAARYRRRTDLAHAALVAERRRFPNSPRATDALFLLGRVEESRGAGTAQVLTWYNEYLSRAPAGSYAAEALGRKMILTKEAGGEAQSRAIAEEYLRRFPKGSYAGTARALLRVP